MSLSQKNTKPVNKPNPKAALRDMPHKPGVYIMRDRLGHIIYVGKAKDLKKRASSYFSKTRKPIKTRALVSSIWSIDYHTVKSDAEAVLLEGKLIKEHRPKYNIAFRDDKRFLLLRVHIDDEIPKFSLTRWRKDDGARYFGPFPNATSLRKTLETMTKHYGLRSCTAKTPTETDFKHCHAHITKNCTAPCIRKISLEEYKKRVEEACQFLAGKTQSMIAELQKEMQEAAKALNFEKAASLRNLIEDLKTTTRPTKRFLKRSPVIQTTKNPEKDLKALQESLNLPKIPKIMECFDISNISSTHIVASMVRFVNGIPDKSGYRTYRLKDIKKQDDFASMAEVIRRRYTRLLKENNPLPNLVIVDGGRGQLSSACQELKLLGLIDLPTIGLAKEFEEIYRPNHPLPLQLSQCDPGLQLLQRIRDEAHRTANGYHSLLLKKRVRESLLDQVEGINHTKKKELLKKFGSVERIKSQTAQTLAETPTIGLGLARKILETLNENTYLRATPKAHPKIKKHIPLEKTHKP